MSTKKLKRSITFPKGTVVDEISETTFYDCYECMVSLTKDIVGYLVIPKESSFVPTDGLDRWIGEGR